MISIASVTLCSSTLFALLFFLFHFFFFFFFPFSVTMIEPNEWYTNAGFGS